MYYEQSKGDDSGCKSGTKMPFPASRKNTTEPDPPRTTVDGKRGTAIEWEFKPDVFLDCAKNEWKPGQPYGKGDRACDPDTDNRVYEVIVGGTSSDKEHKPSFAYPTTRQRPIWSDIGKYPPASVTGAAATDQVVTLLNFQLPQTHALSYYNLASGVLVTTIRTKTFAYSAIPGANNATSTQGPPIQTGSTLLIDPVITLTRYIWPFDAEQKQHWKDLRPGVSLSFSLSSPTSNFYIGGSSEFLRYIQLEYGFAIAKVPHLATNTYAASSSTTPATVQSFAKGAYVGLSFNISGLIQGLTGSGGGGGGGGGGKGSSSSPSPSGP
jgi:hypothetical protein